MSIIPLVALLVAITAEVSANTTPEKGEWKLASESQQHMGTEFTIQFYHQAGQDPTPALKEAFAKIAALDRMMTDYDPESELSKLGAGSPHDKPVPVSEDLWRILDAGNVLSADTGGAFDASVGPLTKLWRQARRQKKIPEQEKLTAALKAVGYRDVQLTHKGDGYFVQLTKPNMRLDLGGIAQGYAADAAFAILERHGFPRALVNASGDIRVGEAPPDKSGWRIGLTGLQPKGEAPTKFVILKQTAISTSGDAFQFVEVEGKRYSHIVDPKTGLGLTTRMSVTTITPRCTEADALATALCILGPKGADEKLQKKYPGLRVLWVSAENGKVRQSTIGKFDELYER